MKYLIFWKSTKTNVSGHDSQGYDLETAKEMIRILNNHPSRKIDGLVHWLKKDVAQEKPE